MSDSAAELKFRDPPSRGSRRHAAICRRASTSRLPDLGDALALIMVVIVVPLMVIYQLLQRRTTRWLR